MPLTKKSILTGGTIITTALVITVSAFATTVKECVDKYYPNLSLENSDTYPVKCASVADIDGNGGYITIYAKTSADCASASTIYSDIESCGGKKLENSDEVIKTFEPCVGEGHDYPNLSLNNDDTYIIKCPSVKYGNDYVRFYAKTSADCASASRVAGDPDSCVSDEDIAPAPEPTKPAEDTTDTIGATTKDNNKKDDGSGTLIAIVIIVAAIIGIIVGAVIFLIPKEKKNQTPPTQPTPPMQPTQPNPFQQQPNSTEQPNPFQQQPPQN